MRRLVISHLRRAGFLAKRHRQEFANLSALQPSTGALAIPSQLMVAGIVERSSSAGEVT
jgi:hypothetical protein